MKTELDQLGKEAREVLVAPVSDGVPAAFLDRADGTTRRRRFVAAGTALVVLLGMSVAIVLRESPAPVVALPVLPTPAPIAPGPLVLGDGTVIESGPASDLRIETSGASASVRLARGHVEVRAPRASATTIQLGRWTVHVTNAARFAADTSLVDGTLLVLEGSVELRAGDDVRSLQAGDRFDVFAEPVVAAPVPVPASPHVVKPVQPPTRVVKPAAVVTPTVQPAKWADWVSDGNASAVLEEALPRLDDVLRDESATVLLALADAARFDHRDEVAVRACETLRRRFPGSAQAATARFSEGRLAEQKGALTQALAHYEAYDVEAPNGPLAAEALARRVQLESSRGAAERACELAKSYVVRFPSGPLASTFRERCMP